MDCFFCVAIYHFPHHFQCLGTTHTCMTRYCEFSSFWPQQVMLGFCYILSLALHIFTLCLLQKVLCSHNIINAIWINIKFFETWSHSVSHTDLEHTVSLSTTPSSQQYLFLKLLCCVYRNKPKDLAAFCF